MFFVSLKVKFGDQFHRAADANLPRQVEQVSHTDGFGERQTEFFHLLIGVVLDSWWMLRAHIVPPFKSIEIL
jgi:hypothetical protein